MKVTHFGPGGFPWAHVTNFGGVTVSIGSNTNTDPPLSSKNFVQAITVDGAGPLLNPIVNVAAGSNITLTIDKGPGNSTPSNTVRIHATGGGSVSYGSNATRVSEIPSVGALTTVAREDHIHDGIGTVTASSSNTLQRGTVNLRSGNNVSFGLTDTDGDGEFDTVTIHATAAGGGGGGGGAPTTAKYVTTEADATLSAEVVRPQLNNYFAETKPTSANATYDDEFDDASGMSGTNNGDAAKWAWRNQSTATLTYTKQGWGTLSIPASASAAWRIREIASIADGTYDMRCSLEGQANNDVGSGIVIIDRTNGDFYSFGIYFTSGATQTLVQRWTNVTTFSATIAGAFGYGGIQTGIYLRVVKSGTSLVFWQSSDGIGFIRIGNVTSTVGEDGIGFGMYETNNTGLSKLHVDYFRKTA